MLHSRDGSDGRRHGDSHQQQVIERLEERFTVARSRSRAAADERRLCFHLREALWVAHDLYMLGCIATPPTLRWRVEEAEEALAKWDVRVIADPRDLFDCPPA